jgi:hypothetical protein
MHMPVKVQLGKQKLVTCVCSTLNKVIPWTSLAKHLRKYSKRLLHYLGLLKRFSSNSEGTLFKRIMHIVHKVSLTACISSYFLSKNHSSPKFNCFFIFCLSTQFSLELLPVSKLYGNQSTDNSFMFSLYNYCNFNVNRENYIAIH